MKKNVVQYLLTRTRLSITAPTITSSVPAAPAYGVAYSHTYTATGYPAPTWSVTAGALPDGLSLHATTGVLSGTPTASGNFTFTVTATNSAGTADQAATVAVLPGFTVTTTGAATLTIAALTVSASTTVYWGDGTSNAYTGTGARTHAYADAGTWKVYFSSATTVTVLNLGDNKITLNSGGIKSMVNMATFRSDSGKSAVFNSSDVAAWNPISFQLTSLAAGGTGTFNSSDVAAWNRVSEFLFGAMPSGYTGTLNSADVSAWNPVVFQCVLMPASYTITITAGALANFNAITGFYMNGNTLSQAKVDQILADLYAAFATRTGTNGTINLGGSNAAPSGTLQAACPPTTGKEAAYELVNDSCGVTTNHWATVTITA